MQRLIQVGLLPGGQGTPVARTDQGSQPRFLKFEVGRRIRQLQRIETCRNAVGQRQVLASQGPDENLQAPILVEHNLSDPLSVQQGDQETNEHRLAGTGGATDKRVSRILWSGSL